MYKTFFCILQAKTLDLGCVEDPENAKEEEQLGVQSLIEVTIVINVIIVIVIIRFINRKNNLVSLWAIFSSTFHPLLCTFEEGTL